MRWTRTRFLPLDSSACLQVISPESTGFRNTMSSFLETKADFERVVDEQISLGASCPGCIVDTIGVATVSRELELELGLGPLAFVSEKHDCTLEELFEQRKSTGQGFTGSELVQLVSGVFKAIATLNARHPKAVISDITPASIVVIGLGTPELKIKLSDCSLSDYIVAWTSYSLCGNLLYKAPQAISGSAPSPYADVYSCGITFSILAVKYLGDPCMKKVDRFTKHIARDAAKHVLNDYCNGLGDVVWECCECDGTEKPTAAQVLERLQALHVVDGK